MRTPFVTSSQRPLQSLGRFTTALACLGLFVLINASAARAMDDNENSAPTAWWTYARQSYGDIVNTIRTRNARVIEIEASNSAFTSYTVTYVRNSGSYAKQWWWYVGIDANALSADLAANNARLISLKAYDVGGGNIRFAAAMISNTGADAKAWWWYSNTSPKIIAASIAANDARLLDLTAAGDGNFNAVMESCSGGCPAWWWRHGMSASEIVSAARDNGARVITAANYQACDLDPCFAAVMINNTPADVTACDPQGCISEAKLSADICGALANRVVGYSCLVGEMRPLYGGLARTSANPPSLSMTPGLATNIASVSKTMTAIAILQLLAKDGLTIDARISPYIYPDWRQGLNIDQLTFKELLTHTSGFGQSPLCSAGLTYAALEKL